MSSPSPVDNISAKFLFLCYYLIHLLGKYRTQLYDDQSNDYLPASPGIGMHVEVLDPENKVILSKFYSSEGRFTFTSHTPGEHHICLHTNSTRWSLFAGGRLVSRIKHFMQSCCRNIYIFT